MGRFVLLFCTIQSRKIVSYIEISGSYQITKI